MDDRTVYMDVEGQRRSKYDKIKKRRNNTIEWVSSEKTTISLALLFCAAMMIVYVWQSNGNNSPQNTTNPFLKWLHDSHSNHNMFPSHALFTPRF